MGASETSRPTASETISATRRWKRAFGVVTAILIAVVVGLAVLAEVPLRPVTVQGAAYGDNVATGGSAYLNPTYNLSLHSGANVTGVVVQWTTVGSYHMNMTVGTICLLHPCLGAPSSPTSPPLLYSATNDVSGGFSWECGHPWSCQVPLGIVTSANENQTWDLQWEVLYTYPATVPYL